MTDKKLRKSIDKMRSDLQELAESIASLRSQVSTQQAAAAAERQQRTTKGTSATTEALQRLTGEGGGGHLSAFGYFRATHGDDGAMTYQWTLEELPVQEVLDLDVEHTAQVLAAIGHHQRLNILLMMLAKPATANDVVTDLSLGTTGAAYHHLNVLQAAGLVEQRQRGTFSIIPDQVPALLTVLTGLSGAIGVDVSTGEAASEAPAAS